jgi:orotidine-5'-phosphate decarboxylase
MLTRRWNSADSVLCVGLDPDMSRLPDAFQSATGGIAKFCVDIIDATADFVCAFKPQIAYFSAVGAERQLELVCEHIRDAHPDIPIILDAKRGDIGDTAKLYAREAFERYGAHAVTVNPYLGTDSLEPFFEHTGKGVFVLCRTSNAGSGEFQSQLIDGVPLYQRVAQAAATSWAQRGDVGLVVGATYPHELAEVRAIVGDMPLLVPGVGAQGGSPADVMNHAATPDGYGVVVNSSRAILFADVDDHVAGARKAAQLTRDQLRTNSAK